jgi:hypothetical protein
MQKERADDVRCYAMTASFLMKYPEFQGDVPMFDPVPRLMPEIGRGDMFCHFPVNKRSLEQGRVEEIQEERARRSIDA